MWVVLCRAGVIGTSERPGLCRRAAWFLAVVFTLSAVANVASQSGWENFLLGPVAAVLAVLCLVVASATPVER